MNRSTRSDQNHQLRKLIDKAENIVFLGGAGVSTESNIPDFRSESGLYATKKKYGVSPETILSHTYFMNHMDRFFDFYRESIIHKEAKPNEAHRALARLEDSGKLKALITQNIDGLHQQAGSIRVLELHGSIHRNACMNCGASYTLDSITASEGIPLCVDCDYPIKPEVTLYEEGLNERVLSESIEAVREADLMIVGGTSLKVNPAAGLIRYFSGSALVIINREETPYDHMADLIIRDTIGAVLGGVVD